MDKKGQSIILERDVESTPRVVIGMIIAMVFIVLAFIFIILNKPFLISLFLILAAIFTIWIAFKEERRIKKEFAENIRKMSKKKKEKLWKDLLGNK